MFGQRIRNTHKVQTKNRTTFVRSLTSTIQAPSKLLTHLTSNAQLPSVSQKLRKKNQAFLSLLKINNGFRIKIQITVYLLKHPTRNPLIKPTLLQAEGKNPTSVKIINIFMNL